MVSFDAHLSFGYLPAPSEISVTAPCNANNICITGSQSVKRKHLRVEFHHKCESLNSVACYAELLLATPLTIYCNQASSVVFCFCYR